MIFFFIFSHLSFFFFIQCLCACLPKSILRFDLYAQVLQHTVCIRRIYILRSICIYTYILQLLTLIVGKQFTSNSSFSFIQFWFFFFLFYISFIRFLLVFASNNAHTRRYLKYYTVFFIECSYRVLSSLLLIHFTV